MLNKATSWVKSYLTNRFYRLPTLKRNSPVADVYLSLNDPRSFMLLQTLIGLEKKASVTFKLHLVLSNTSCLAVEDTIQLKASALKDANNVADKLGLLKVHSFPNAEDLITGQQAWFLSGRTVKDTLDIFINTWYSRFTEHYSLSTPVITAQFKNKHRLIKKGHDSSSVIYFSGSWFKGSEGLQALIPVLNNKDLLRESVDVNNAKDALVFLKNIFTVTLSPESKKYISIVDLEQTKEKSLTECDSMPLAFENSKIEGFQRAEYDSYITTREAS